jgi:signal transduction histidine kinase/DNA-binding response OmpR family regulator
VTAPGRWRFGRWSLRSKMLLLLLCVSTVPLMLATAVGLHQGRQRVRQQAVWLLEARADQLRSETDHFHRRNQALARNLAQLVEGALPDLVPAQTVLDRWRTAMEGLVRSGQELRSALVTDTTGKVLVSTEMGGGAQDLAFRPYVKAALAGESHISDLFFPLSLEEPEGLIAYSTPLRDPAGAVWGSVAVFVKASALWRLVRSMNDSAGAGSYAVLYDRSGVRIAHGTRDDLLFRPAAPLPQTDLDRMVAERRFGPRTGELLSRPARMPDQDNLARAPWLDEDSQHARRYRAESNQTFNLSVARRLDRVPWTLFAQVPESAVYAFTNQLLLTGLGVSALVAVLALGLGLVLSRGALRPLRDLSAATEAMTRGELGTRVPVQTRDEVGLLAGRFNQMATSLQAAQERLEERVRERTTDLEKANEELRAQREELVTQRGELQSQQRELELKSEQALKADRLKSEFLANMSHELRTPLNSIIGFTELLQDEAAKVLTARQREFLDDVLGSGRHLLALINDILDLSKIEAGQMDLDRQPVAPAAVMDDACQLMQPAVQKKPLILKRRPDAAREVLADRSKLLQVLLNLLSNAVKFSPPGTIVEVGSELQPGSNGGADHVRFWVRDQGIGVDSALRQRLFQPFTQGENPLTKKHQGTGLGLAICKRLVEQHVGVIGMESAVGEGSTFWFTMPATTGTGAADELTDVTAPPLLARMADGRARRVLVIDDDPAVGTLLRGLLERAGYVVAVAETAREGLTMARQQLPDALVVDLCLPDASGISVIEELGKDPRTRGRPILVLTGQDLPEADRARLRPQVTAIARKGDVLRTELLAKLDAALHPKDGSGSSPSKGRILVVDDHDLNRELVRSILERRGYEVLQAEDGEAGVTLAQKARPDVILMDLAMPRKDGFAATRELKAALETRSIPIVALTALAMRGDEERAVAAGVDGYLTKPVDRKRLEETVERLMSARRAAS